MTSSRVQYVGKGGDYSKHGYEFTGSMRVLESIMRYGYLWTKLRVQGGAYGASAVFYRDGLMMFTSYRDPNLTETLDVYDTIADYIRSFTASDREMTKYIIGTISTVDMPMTPRMKGDTAAQLWLRGVTYDDRQKARDEILSTGIIDIQKLAGLVEACMKDNNYCVFGNEEKLTEHKDCFTKLVRVME
jgi:Zn-dependent M16 (insulinase) family peptidase